jgi:hypothetical protein
MLTRITLAGFLVSLTLIVGRQDSPTTIDLGWTKSPDPLADSYRIYYGLGSSNYNLGTVLTPDTNACTITTNFPRGVPIFFNIKAVNAASGDESVFDGEISYTFPPLPSPPANFHRQ